MLVAREEASPTLRDFAAASAPRALGLIDTFNDEFWRDGARPSSCRPVGPQIGSLNISKLRRAISLQDPGRRAVLATEIAPHTRYSYEQKHIAIEIQRYWRAYKKRRLDAAETIQRMMRNRKARHHVDALRHARNYLAATKVSCLGRGFVVRTRRRLAEEVREANAASVLTRGVRCRAARKEVHGRRSRRNARAARNVQANARRFISKRLTKLRRKKKSESLASELATAAAFARSSASNPGGSQTTELVLGVHFVIGAPEAVVRRMYRSRLLSDPLDARLAYGFGTLIATGVMEAQDQVAQAARIAERANARTALGFTDLEGSSGGGTAGGELRVNVASLAMPGPHGMPATPGTPGTPGTPSRRSTSRKQKRAAAAAAKAAAEAATKAGDHNKASSAQAYFDLGMRLDRSGAVRDALEKFYLKASCDANPKSARHLRTYLAFLEGTASGTARGRREAEGLRYRIGAVTGQRHRRPAGAKLGMWDAVAIVRESRMVENASSPQAKGRSGSKGKSPMSKKSGKWSSSRGGRGSAAQRRRVDPRDNFVGRRDLLALWEVGCAPGRATLELRAKDSLDWVKGDTRSFIVHPDEIAYVKQMLRVKRDAAKVPLAGVSGRVSPVAASKQGVVLPAIDGRAKQNQAGLKKARGHIRRTTRAKVVPITDAEVEMFVKRSAVLIRHSRTRGGSSAPSSSRVAARVGGDVCLDVVVPFLVRRRSNKVSRDRIEAAAVRMQSKFRATKRAHAAKHNEKFSAQKMWQQAGARAARVMVIQKVFYRARMIAKIQAIARRQRQARQFQAEKRAATKLQALGRSFRERRQAKAEALRRKFGLQAELVYACGRRISGIFVLVRAWKCGVNFIIEAYDPNAASTHDCIVLEEQVRALLEAYRCGEIGWNRSAGDATVTLDSPPTTMASYASPMTTSPTGAGTPLPTDATTASERARETELAKRQKLSVGNTSGIVDVLLSMMVFIDPSKRVAGSAARAGKAGQAVLAINDLFSTIGHRAAPHVYARAPGRALGDCRTIITNAAPKMARAAAREPSMAKRIKAYNVDAVLPHLPGEEAGATSIYRKAAHARLGVDEDGKAKVMRWRLQG